MKLNKKCDSEIVLLCRFPYVLEPGGAAIWEYAYNPCYGFSDGSVECKNAIVSITHNNTYNMYTTQKKLRVKNICAYKYKLTS